MKAQEHLGGVARTLVEVVDAQSLVALEVADVMRREWVARQVGEAFVGCAQTGAHR